MPEQTLSDVGVIDWQEREPIILVGQPDALKGELRMHNSSMEKIALRNAQLRSEPLGTAVPGMATSLTHLLPAMVLRPGEVRHIPLTIAINPHTPPGEYRGEIEIAGRVRPVLLQVTESVQLDISPPQLVVENRVGKALTKRVVLTNSGNVPLTIGEIGPVELKEELTFTERLTELAAIIGAGNQVKEVSDYLAEVIRQSRVTLERTSALRVHNTAGTIVLQPGEVRPIDLEIRVPDKLDSRTRYVGAAALYTSDLQFVVVPAPADRGQQPGDEARGRPLRQSKPKEAT